jgi:methylsterol monooxygenase
MNSTQILSHRATSSELYTASGTDFSKLSWLEANWAAWYLLIGDPVIATGLMSFLLHEVRL